MSARDNSEITYATPHFTDGETEAQGISRTVIPSLLAVLFTQVWG